MRILVRPLFLLLVLSATSFAQAAVSPSKVSTEELDSKLMGLKMPYQVILPDNYSDKAQTGRRYPVLYLLHGLTGNFSNWTSKTQIVSYSSGRELIIVAVEGGNGWYTDELTKSGGAYESYIVKELIPEIDKRYRTNDSRNQRAIAGLSMGGYGAIKFGLKYPDMFAVVGSFSAAIGVASITEKTIPGAIGKSIDAIFGPAGTEIRKANDPFDIVRRASADKIKTFPFLYLDCGTEDMLFKSNRDFADLLLEKNVPHEFRELPGGHSWPYWNAQLEEFLRVASGIMDVADVAESDPSHPLEPIITAQQIAQMPIGQGATRVTDLSAARMLSGRHKLSLQWVSWDNFGVATVTNRGGSYFIKGEQRGRGNGDFVTIEGRITSVDKKEFAFTGKIVTQVSHINGGKPCVRDGDFTFKITGKRRYWRLQQMDNPCDPVTDYVDIYFR